MMNMSEIYRYKNKDIEIQKVYVLNQCKDCILQFVKKFSNLCQNDALIKHNGIADKNCTGMAGRTPAVGGLIVCE